MVVDLHEYPGTVIRVRQLCQRFLNEHRVKPDPEEIACVQRILQDLSQSQIQKADFDFITDWYASRSLKHHGARPH